MPKRKDDVLLPKESEVKETSIVTLTNNSKFNVDEQLARLTTQEKKQITTLKKSIDFGSTTNLMNYGSQVINSRSSISDSILEKYKNKDIGEIGDTVTSLVTELRSYDLDKVNKGFFSFLKRTKNKIEAIRTQYEKANQSIKVVIGKLEGEIVTLSNDINLLDKMYENNIQKFKDHTIYLIAGKQKLEEVRKGELLDLLAKAQETGLPEDSEAYNQLESRCNNFEKYLYNLELSRALCLLSLPRIKAIQNSNEILIDKIKQTINYVMPLWKDSIAEAIIGENTRKALELQNSVDNATNEMLRKIVDKSKSIQIETAKASQRGIVDIDTIKYMFETTISAMEEVRGILVEGKQQMYENEKELNSMEEEYVKTSWTGVDYK